MATTAQFDRSKEDLGNITSLEHVNVLVDSQLPATDFYLAGMGFTRDPYIMPSTQNMWVNLGTSQFHLPKGKPQVLRGVVGVVVPDLDQLMRRLDAVQPALEGTKFAFKRHNSYVEATCPWGNKIHAHRPDIDRFGAINLGMPYVEFNVPPGTAEGIVRFYCEIMGAQAGIENGDGRQARIAVGQGQSLVYRETEGALPEYDGHHIAVYIQDFSGPHRKLQELGLITEESDQWQYRFLDIVDPADGKHLFRIEHEVRSMTHPLHGRPFVNRNPMQTNRNYRPGRDAWAWSIEHDPNSDPGPGRR